MIRFCLAAFTVVAILSASAQANIHTYHVDQSQSALSIVGGQLSLPGGEQYPLQASLSGSLIAPLTGRVDAAADGNTVQLVGTSLVQVVDHTPYLPGPLGDPSTPTNGSFAVTFPTINNLGFDVAAVTRGLIFTLLDAAPKPVGMDGSFAADGTSWAVVAGVADLNVGIPPQLDLTMSPFSTNSAMGPASLISDGVTETLSLPIEFPLLVNTDSGMVELNFEGNIVATRAVPEPASATLCLMVGAVATFKRRRRVLK